MMRSFKEVSWLKNAAAFRYSFVSLNCWEISAGDGLRVLLLILGVLSHKIAHFELG